MVGGHAEGPAWWLDPAGMSKRMVGPDQADQQPGTSGNVSEDIIELVGVTGKMLEGKVKGKDTSEPDATSATPLTRLDCGVALHANEQTLFGNHAEPDLGDDCRTCTWSGLICGRKTKGGTATTTTRI